MHRNGSSSMVQLKKFFRPARKEGHGGANNHHLPGVSPSPSYRKPSPSPATPSGPTFTHDANNNMIVKTDPKFWDDLEGSVAKKYGKLGKVLGSGAGGSVRLIVRESDGVTFAVKEFVPRRPNESVKEYAKKCTAEFCIGSTLHHPNVIQTLDIINENNHFYEVMEYAPIDFFAVVMSGKMTRSEINCCFKQITLGVSYLHSVGLSHRDLKLDNCVVTKEGIVKLIDFGSAVVFKYPFEEDIVNAHGIVGSDPYLAPEVLTSTEDYDPQFVDIWSVGIIYCCMTLRRFPWKAPKADDPSFSLYCMEDDQPHDYVDSAKKHKELLQERKKKIILAQRLKDEENQRILAEKTSELKISNENNNENVNVNSINDDSQKEVNDNNAKDDSNKDNSNSSIPQDAVENSYKNIDIDGPITGCFVPAPAPPQTADQENNDQTASEENNESKPSSHETTEQRQESNHHHHHHHHNNTNTEGSSAEQHNIPQPNQPEQRQNQPQKIQKQIHGPYRLMRLLPHASRPIISKILSVDISTRATMKEILNDEWFQEIKYCTIDEDGNTINDPSHTHTIV